MKRQLSQYVPFKLVIILMTFLVLLTSCEDYLDQTPTDGLVYSEYWQNKEQVLSTLGGAYQMFAELDYLLFVQGELRGDMLYPGPSIGTSQLQVMTANIQQNQYFANWDKYYSVINVCNHVIDLAPGVQDRDLTFSPYLLQQYVSEATFIRSLCYFYLVRIFQDVPYITEPSSTDQGDFFPEVTSGVKILEYVKADLDAIRIKMPEHPTLKMSKSRATAGACNALLADICLWNFDYDGCISYIDAVEDLNEYFLIPGGEWFNNFSDGFTYETIFEIYFDQASGQGNSINEKTYADKRTDVVFYVSEYAYDILNSDVALAGEQIRGDGSISNSHQIWKYAGAKGDGKTVRSSGIKSSANFIIYRLADLYLMKAEAYSQLGEYAQAQEYLNKVRRRALMTEAPNYNDKALFEDAIMLERAKELAFEGKRWFDLVRMGRRTPVGKEKLLNILIQNAPSTQQLVLKSRLKDENGWYMPIHLNEIGRNKNLKQNSYYDENN